MSRTLPLSSSPVLEVLRVSYCDHAVFVVGGSSVINSLPCVLLVRSLARPIFFPRIDDSHCDRNHSSLTAVWCFDNAYVGKQPVAWKEYCAEYWLKELWELMDRFTGRRDITEILLKMALNTIQSINFTTFLVRYSWNCFFFFLMFMQLSQYQPAMENIWYTLFFEMINSLPNNKL